MILSVAAAVLAPSVSAAQTDIVIDDLTDSTGCSVMCPGRTHVGANGNFQADGWHQASGNARVVYDLGQAVDCGRLEFDLTNFDPTTQVAANGGVDEYHPLWRLNENDQGLRCNDVTLHDSTLHVQVLRGGNHRFDFRLSAWAGCCGGRNAYTQGDFAPWDLSHTYHVEMEWDADRVNLTVRDLNTNETHSVTTTTNLGWPPGDTDPTLNLGYLWLGRDETNFGQPMSGPIWTNVVVQSLSNCATGRLCECCDPAPDDPDVEVPCGDCGTQLRDCTAQCMLGAASTACQGPDPNTPCDTGQLGVCADGVLLCVDGNHQCDPLAGPTTEVCGDGLDNDCDGVTDNGCGGPDGGQPPGPDGSIGPDANGTVSDGAGVDPDTGSGPSVGSAKGGCDCRASDPRQSDTRGPWWWLVLAGLLLAGLVRRR
jgi:hypothetical protein